MVLALESQITLLSIDNTSTMTPLGSTSLDMPPPKLATENTGVDCCPHNVASQPPNLGMSIVTDAPETDADQVRVLI